MDAALDALIHSPKLPQYVSQLSAVLSAEATLRQKFYEESIEERKWEFINGEVVLHGPAKNRDLRATMNISTLMDAFVSIHRLGVVHTQKCMCRFPRNDYEPDVVFFGNDKAALFDPLTMLFPPPDLVVEVLSDSTEARDRGVKFEDYGIHVPEYWIVDSEAEVVEQYVQGGQAYRLKFKADAGVLTSVVVKGFSMPVRAIFDEEENLSAVRGMVAEGGASASAELKGGEDSLDCAYDCCSESC